MKTTATMKTVKLLTILCFAANACFASPEKTTKQSDEITILGVGIGASPKSFLENPEIKKATSMESECYNKEYNQLALELKNPENEKTFLQKSWGGSINYKPEFKKNDVTLMGLTVEYARMEAKYDPTVKQFRITNMEAFLPIPADSNFEKTIKAAADMITSQWGTPKNASTYQALWGPIGENKTMLALSITNSKKLSIQITSNVINDAITEAQMKQLKTYRDAVAAPKITSGLK